MPSRRTSIRSSAVAVLAVLLLAASGLPTGPAAQGPAVAAAVFVDTTAADFAAGTLDPGGYIAEMEDGEVILAPTYGTEFSGTTLPDGLSLTPWFPGGASRSAGGC